MDEKAADGRRPDLVVISGRGRLTVSQGGLLSHKYGEWQNAATLRLVNYYNEHKMNRARQWDDVWSRHWLVSRTIACGDASERPRRPIDGSRKILQLLSPALD